MIELVSGTHSTAHPGFDPFTLLPFFVPALLVLPLVGFAIIVSTFRTRRPALNTARFFTLASLLLAIVSTYAVARHANLFTAAYQWINLSLAFTGPAAFQGFGIDVSLQLDHAGAVCILGLLVIVLFALSWSSLGSRAEPGPVRLYSLLTLSVFAALGVALSGDLAALLAFWILLGVCTYLMLANRWGSEDAARSSRLAFSLPFLGDLALLLAVALLYSRYGRTDIPFVFGILHSTAGWGYKSLTAIAILVFVAAAVRTGMVPFVGWLTRNAWTSTPANLIVQGTWPILAAFVVYRLLPLFKAAGPQALTVMAVASLASALIAGVFALLESDAGRALAVSGTAHAALVFVVLARGDAALGLSVALAGALARSGAILALGNLAAAMRTRDLAAMGEAFRRLRVTSLALASSTLAMAISLAIPGARGLGNTVVAAAFGVGLVLVAAGFVRVYVLTAYAALPRRRAFDPQRAVEAPPVMRLSALVLAVGGLALALVGAIPAWLVFVDGHARRGIAPFDVAGWIMLAALAVAGGAVLLRARTGVTSRLAAFGRRWDATWAAAAGAYSRWLAAPGLGVIEDAESRGVTALESEVAGSLGWLGRLAWARSGEIVLGLIAIIALLALAAAIVEGSFV